MTSDEIAAAAAAAGLHTALAQFPEDVAAGAALAGAKIAALTPPAGPECEPCPAMRVKDRP